MDARRGITLPPPVMSVIERLKSCGYTVFIAGGAVRDIVMNRQRPVDWDIATSATPAEVSSCFDHVVPTGVAHGTVTVVAGGMNIEVTTYRHDGPYVDGRRPEYVVYLDDIVADLARRDFTVNAMAFDPATGELVDPYGGADDIERCLIRCVGDPAHRFSEDKLRMLRAIRFAATLGFDVDTRVVDAARSLAPEIEQVSVERIMDELMKTMRAPKPGAALLLMEKMGLAPHVFPELCSEAGEEERRRLYAACDLLSPEPEERFAALLWPLGPKGSRHVLGRMRASREFSLAVSRIIEGARDLEEHPSDYQLRLAVSRIDKVRDVSTAVQILGTAKNTESATVTLLDMGTGRVWMEVTAPKALFYAVISEMSGLQVAGDSDVIRMMRDLTFAKREYDKVAVALEQVKATGYGIVTPFLEEIYFAEPDIIRQGNRCGVRLKAMAPSIHMIRADIKTEVTPLMGTEKQSEEFAEQIAEDFAENPSKIWETEFLGRSMQDLIREGIEAKLAHMPVHAQEKLQETLQKIVNEGSGGLICIVL
jgi:tRNA nucleotidyltransferase/poly(A) polymerase